MKFACPNCAKKYNLADEKLSARDNVRLKCRQCSEGITVKEGGIILVPALVDEAAAHALSEAPPPLPTPPPPASFPSPAHDAAGSRALTSQPPRPVSGQAGAEGTRHGAGTHGLTPPLPPLSPSGAPPPPAPSPAALALETSLSASAALSTATSGGASPLVPVAVTSNGGGGRAAEGSGARALGSDEAAPASMRPSLSALSGHAAVWVEKFHGLEEQQRLWSALGVGVVIGLMLGALLF